MKDRCNAYLVLGPVDAGEGTDESEDVLQCVGTLKRINVSQSSLDVREDDELRQPQKLTAQLKGHLEAGLGKLPCRKSLDRLQFHGVVEMEIVEVLQKRQHENVHR